MDMRDFSQRLKLVNRKIIHRFQQIGSYIKKLVIYTHPGETAFCGAAYGLIATGLVIILISVFQYIGVLSLLIQLGMILYFALTGIFSALAIVVICWIIKKIPPFFRFVLIAFIAVCFSLFDYSTKSGIYITLLLTLAVSLFTGALALFITSKWKNLPGIKKVLSLSALTAGFTALIIFLFWIISVGKYMQPMENAAMKTQHLPVHLSMPNPSDSGEYKVLQMFYGSGTDKNRPEYGKNTNITTLPVDGSPFVKGWKKLHGWTRTRYWGFDEKSLPLNGRIWYPLGEGPYPLVVMVHGNHMDRDYSDPGYAYLGELLASKGYIFVSVDQNFLNGSWTNIFDKLDEENDCRGWLLLKHLEVWREWNKDENNPFFQKIDMEHIALVGHSRGGEAVAVAACFNELSFYPDDASIAFDFHFNIRSVVAIAPVDGQYKPASTPTPLDNINYFVMQGSYDMDVRSYEGLKQYQRIRFTDSLYHFKSGLYIYRANHGQFNSRWGRNDLDYPVISLFNRNALIPEKDQQTIAKVYITAFLETTLKNKNGYISLLKDYRTGRNWLPETIYLNQFEDNTMEFISHYEEDINVASTSITCAHIKTENLTVWKEQNVPLKWSRQENRAVYIGWNNKANDSLTARYVFELDSIPADSIKYLVLNLADANEKSLPDKEEEKNKGPIDFSILFTNKAAISHALPLSQYAYLQPAIVSPVMKASFLSDKKDTEAVFQYYQIPLEDAVKSDTSFHLKDLASISLVFDKTPEGVIILDNVGFMK